jgi:hypothetical protein
MDFVKWPRDAEFIYGTLYYYRPTQSLNSFAEILILDKNKTR